MLISFQRHCTVPVPVGAGLGDRRGGHGPQLSHLNHNVLSERRAECTQKCAVGLDSAQHAVSDEIS